MRTTTVNGVFRFAELSTHVDPVFDGNASKAREYLAMLGIVIEDASIVARHPRLVETIYKVLAADSIIKAHVSSQQMTAAREAAELDKQKLKLRSENGMTSHELDKAVEQVEKFSDRATSTVPGQSVMTPARRLELLGGSHYGRLALRGKTIKGKSI